MTHFPMFFDLKDRSVLIFGGGSHALQRVQRLKPFSPRITVISQTICGEILETEGITCHQRPFRPEDLDCYPVLAVIAEDRETTGAIYAECRKRHIPVNAVDMPEFCDIIFPAVLTTEHLCVGISSGGMSPTAAMEFRDRLAGLLPEAVDEILEWMLPLRERINGSLPPNQRKKALRLAFRAAVEQNRPLEEKEIEDVLARL